MGGILWNESPFDVVCGTEFQDDSLCLLMLQKLNKLFQLSVGTDEIGAVVAPYERRLTTTSSKTLLPSVWWNEIEDRRHSVADKRLKTSWIARQPIEHNGAVGPSIDVLDGEVKHFFNVIEKLSE